MEVERTQDLIKSEEGKSLSEIDILQYWTQNVANIDYAVIIENSALLVSFFFLIALQNDKFLSVEF